MHVVVILSVAGMKRLGLTSVSHGPQTGDAIRSLSEPTLVECGWMPITDNKALQLLDEASFDSYTGVWDAKCLPASTQHASIKSLSASLSSTDAGLLVSPIPSPKHPTIGAMLAGAHWSHNFVSTANPGPYITSFHMELDMVGGLATLISASGSVKIWQFIHHSKASSFVFGGRHASNSCQPVPPFSRKDCVWCIQRHGETVITPEGWYHRVWTASKLVGDELAELSSVEAIAISVDNAVAHVRQFGRASRQRVSAVLWGANWPLAGSGSIQRDFADRVCERAQHPWNFDAAAVAYETICNKDFGQFEVDVAKKQKKLLTQRKRKKAGRVFYRRKRRQRIQRLKLKQAKKSA